MSMRDEIRGLCIAHDRLMAEQASEPISRPPVSESNAGLVFKTIEDALAPAPPPAAVPSSEGDDGYWRDEVARAMGAVADATIDTLRRDLAKRDRRIAKLENKLAVVLTLLGSKKSADVVELPPFLKRRTTNAT